ncbi:glycosyltransferase [Gramella jeungdoensis]|uniref:Glycosyltransferase n=1 Tax=Gramella jeungdoensis TaxID=708091 RepID=A0ABT0Z4Y2_9FLAO|nr:glycosyltransferase [Gramella jeungdoensis]MCM8570475.1 glycosyltransferase [Gramella jeungdoensis]
MHFSDFLKKFEKIKVKEYPNQVSSFPKVSILIQTFEHVDFIDKCVHSILNQKTDFEYEIILGEDLSSDGTREKCISLAEKHPNHIRLFLHHAGNKIKVDNFVTGNFNIFYNLIQAKGKYIALCDGDDYWDDPQKLYNQVNFLENNPSYILCFHDYNIISSNKKDAIKLMKPINKDISSQELQKCQVYPLTNTICFRNIHRDIPEEILEVFNIDSFWFSILGGYGGGKYLKSIRPSYYRVHEGGTWTNKNKAQNFMLKILFFEKLSAFYKKKKYLELSNYHNSQMLMYRKMLTYYYLKRLKISMAIKSLYLK